MRFWIVLALVALLTAATAVFVGSDAYWRVQGYRLAGAHRAVQLASTTVYAVLATSEAERQKGLGGTDGLAPDEGMLFVYETEGRYAFWMKDMHYNIDIIWITASGTVAGLWENVATSSYPRAYAPHTPAQYVLEVPTGFAEAHGVKIGDTVRF